MSPKIFKKADFIRYCGEQIRHLYFLILFRVTKKIRFFLQNNINSSCTYYNIMYILQHQQQRRFDTHVSSDVQVPLSTFGVPHEELVEQGVEVDEAAVAPEIVFRLAQEGVLLSIRPEERHLLRPDQRFHDNDLQQRTLI